jgi:hypothetical protein
MNFYQFQSTANYESMGYVDDIKGLLARPPTAPNDAISVLNQDLLAVSRWCCINHPSLLINPDKTKLLVVEAHQFTRSLSATTCVFAGQRNQIKPSPVFKDLGVLIDSNLTYNDHITL